MFENPSFHIITFLVGGCIKFWSETPLFMYKEYTNYPSVTMNISISDHCQSLIFEKSPLTIDGVCIATNIAGEEKKYFKIQLLSHEKSSELIEGSGDTDEVNIKNINIEEIRKLRNSYHKMEKRRVFDQLKVTKLKLPIHLTIYV